MKYNVYDVQSLRRAHEAQNPGSHFFDPDTLRFFGEAFSSMRLLKKPSLLKDVMGEEHECYVLTSLQRNAPGHPRRVSHYFDIKTLEQINAF